MKKGMDSNKPVLVRLYENKLLRSKVDHALKEGSLTYDEIIELCSQYDIEISKSTLTRYKNKLEESEEKDIPLIDLIDKRKKTGNVIDIKDKRPKSTNKEEREESFDKVFDTSEKVINDVQVLDLIIQKGFSTLLNTDFVEIGPTIKAMETKDKITGNSMQGLSLVGLRELKLRNQAKTQAMYNAVAKFVPEEKHEELLEYIEKEEEEFYKNLDLTEEDKRITEALKMSGMDF